jgi:aminoglycoside phosphotransferase (APT) family kinase protein
MIASFLLARWEEMLGEARPSAVRLLQVTARPGPRSSVVFLAFAGDRSSPSLLVKVNRDPLYADAVRAEFENLSAIYARLHRFRPSVPRPLGCWEVEGHLVFCETALVGVPLGGRTFFLPEALKRRRISRFTLAAVKWLAGFHSETVASHMVIDQAFVQERFYVLVERLLARPGGALDGCEGILERLPRTAEKFIGTKLPLGAVHGDFTHANVLFLEGGGLGVVDWEDCASHGLPFPDLFRLVLQSGVNCWERLRSPSGSLQRFFLTGWGSELVCQTFCDYARRRNLDEHLFTLLLPQYIGSLIVDRLPVHRDPESLRFASLGALKTGLEFFHRKFT